MIPFSPLTLLVGKQKRHGTSKKSYSNNFLQQFPKATLMNPKMQADDIPTVANWQRFPWFLQAKLNHFNLKGVVMTEINAHSH